MYMWQRQGSLIAWHHFLTARKGRGMTVRSAAASAVKRYNILRRTYMDVRTRPSHSGMFHRPGTEVPPSRPSPPLESPEASSSIYGLLLSRAAMAAGWIYLVTEYVADITLCEGPSMTPTLRPAGEIVCIDKWTLRRYGVADGCRVTQRIKAAVTRQEAFEKQASKEENEEIWHERRISVSDLGPPTWRQTWELLTSPLSIGDVVVVDHPNRPGTVCKRVVGLPGDTVLRPHAGLLVIPDGHVWLEGDNPVKYVEVTTFSSQEE